MTLKEKLQNEFPFTTKVNIDLCEKVCNEYADDFAIEFARYITNDPRIFNNGASMKQTLLLFKTEKGL